MSSSVMNWRLRFIPEIYPQLQDKTVTQELKKVDVKLVKTLPKDSKTLENNRYTEETGNVRFS